MRKNKRIECPRCKEKNYVRYKSGKGKCYSCNYYGTGKYKTYKGIKCPDCFSENVRKREKVKAGKEKKQRWYCKDCGATWIDGSRMVIRPSHRKEVLNLIKDLKEKGYKRRDIAKEMVKMFGIAVNSAYYWINQVIPPKPKGIPEEIIKKYIEYKKLGFSKETIEATLGYKVKSLEGKLYKERKGH